MELLHKELLQVLIMTLFDHEAKVFFMQRLFGAVIFGALVHKM